MEKLKNQFNISLDDDTAAMVRHLAQTYQRKPAELLRLLVVPAVNDLFLKTESQRPENQTQPTPAHFVRDPFTKI